MGITFKIKQYIKMYIQNRYLPAIYRRYSADSVDEDKIIFADMHSDGLPSSMQAVYDELVKRGTSPIIYCRDFGNMSLIEKISFMRDFMKEYATAGYVYICSYFLPVSSCDKREETIVVQLWHSGGLLKRMGLDTEDDIPKGYRGNVTANYNLVTVSAPICIPVWERALGLPDGITKALGLPRTDKYYDDAWNRHCRELFEAVYPEAAGRRVAIYTPSFSGNASSPICRGLDAGIDRVFDNQEDWYLIIRPHPHLRRKYPEYFDKRSEKLTNDMLLPVADLMITDYSSILFDYSIYKKPFILFCPDIEDYIRDRGFYVNLDEFPYPVVRTTDELMTVVGSLEQHTEELEEFFERYMGSCDGHATDRVLEEVRCIRGIKDGRYND